MIKNSFKLAALALACGGSANAALITMDFEGSSNQGSTNIAVAEFYNGGTDSGGTAGTDFGVSFANANFDSFSATAGLYNIPSSIAYMALSPLVFTSARKFNSIAFDQYFFGGGNVLTVYDGVNGTGNVVFQGVYGQNCTPNCTAQSVSVNLAGFGRSATLLPNANNTGIDNLSINAVPEPAQWALFIGGFAIAGAAARRSRRSAAVTA